MDSGREKLEAEWLRLTRELLPSLAAERRWPVRHDHSFQRILLDHACGGRWYDTIRGRPASQAADRAILHRAVELAGQVAAGSADLHRLNRQSLAWRGRA